MKLIIEDVNIDIKPLPEEIELAIDATTEITLGDLHANAIKLLFMLVKHGVITNIGDEEYNRLVAIYKTPTSELTAELLAEFDGLLGQLQCTSKDTIRLIGDVFCDRGKNDLFTLKLLAKLRKQEVPVEILLSNHDLDFIQALEQQQNFSPARLQFLGHGVSMQALQGLIDKELVSREEIVALAKQVYLPTLKVLSYSLTDDGIVIYSHAGVDLTVIEALAAKFEVAYQDDTAQDLAQTIDRINEKFSSEYVLQGKVSTLYSDSIAKQAYCAAKFEIPIKEEPIAFLTWNRMYDKLNRVHEYKKYRLYWVRGHDSTEETARHCFNLDGPLGKSLNHHIAEYSALLVRHKTMSSALKLLQQEPVLPDESTKTSTPSMNNPHLMFSNSLVEPGGKVESAALSNEVRLSAGDLAEGVSTITLRGVQS